MNPHKPISKNNPLLITNNKPRDIRRSGTILNDQVISDLSKISFENNIPIKKTVNRANSIISGNQSSNLLDDGIKSLPGMNTKYTKRHVSHKENLTDREVIETHDLHEGAGKQFKRFYDKFSNNVDKFLNSDKKNIELVGNHRYAHSTVDDFLKDKEKIYNKFNPKFEKDMENLKELSHNIEENENGDIIELRKLYREKQIEMRNKIELTPLPIKHRKSAGTKEEQLEENKAERSAVIMRRYEYEINLKNKKNKANNPIDGNNSKSKSPIKLTKNEREEISPDYLKENSRNNSYLNSKSMILESDDDNSIEIEGTNENISSGIFSQEESDINIIREEINVQKSGIMHRNSSNFNKDYYDNIKWHAIIIQNKWRKSYQNKLMKKYLLNGKSKIIQRNWKLFYKKKIIFLDYLNSLAIESENFEIIKNKYHFHKIKNHFYVNSNVSVSKNTLAYISINNRLLISSTSSNYYLSNQVQNEIHGNINKSYLVKVIMLQRIFRFFLNKIKIKQRVECGKFFFSTKVNKITYDFKKLELFLLEYLKLIKKQQTRLIPSVIITKTIYSKISSSHILKIQRVFRKLLIKKREKQAENTNNTAEIKLKKIIYPSIFTKKGKNSILDIMKVIFIQRKFKKMLRISKNTPLIKNIQISYSAVITRKVFPIKTLIKIQNNIKQFLKKKKQGYFKSKIKNYFLPIMPYFKRFILNTFETKSKFKLICAIKKLFQIKNKNEIQASIQIIFLKWKKLSVKKDVNAFKMSSCFNTTSNLNLAIKLNFEFNSRHKKLTEVVQNKIIQNDFYKHLAPYIYKKLNQNNIILKKEVFDILSKYEKIKIKEVEYVYKSSSKINSLEFNNSFKRLNYKFQSYSLISIETTAKKNSYNSPTDWIIRYLCPTLQKLDNKNQIKSKIFTIDILKKRAVYNKFFFIFTHIFLNNLKYTFLKRIKILSNFSKFDSIISKLKIKQLCTLFTNTDLLRKFNSNKFVIFIDNLISTKIKKKFLFNLIIKGLEKNQNNGKTIILINILNEFIENKYFIKNKSFTNSEKNISTKIIDVRVGNIFNFLEENSHLIKGYEDKDFKKIKESNLEIINNRPIELNISVSSSSINSDLLRNSMNMNPFRRGHYLVSRNETMTLSDYDENRFKNTTCNTSNISII